VHLVGFIIEKFVTIYDHMNVKSRRLHTDLILKAKEVEHYSNWWTYRIATRNVKVCFTIRRCMFLEYKRDIEYCRLDGGQMTDVAGKKKRDTHCGVQSHDMMYRTRWPKRQSCSLEQGKCLVRIVAEIPAVVNEISRNFPQSFQSNFEISASNVSATDFWHNFQIQGAGIAQSVQWLGYRLDNRGLTRLRSAEGALIFSLLQNVEAGTGAPISLIFIGCRGSSLGGQSGRDVRLTTQLNVAPKWRMSRATPPLPPTYLHGVKRGRFTFTFLSNFLFMIQA